MSEIDIRSALYRLAGRIAESRIPVEAGNAKKFYDEKHRIAKALCEAVGIPVGPIHR